MHALMTALLLAVTLTFQSVGITVGDDQLDATCFCLRQVAGGWSNPIAMVDLNDGRFVVAEQRGLAWLLDVRQPEVRVKFLDIQDRVLSSRDVGDERGLLGIAMHPDYPGTPKVYTYYSHQVGNYQTYSYVSEFTVVRDAVDVTSERVFLRVQQPHEQGNGGQLLFGADGYLYISIGYGGLEGDPQKYAQSPNSFLGKVLRIDVNAQGWLHDRPLPYGIPASNPWVGTSWEPEIFAFGCRNMWRCSVDDKGSQRIFCGDTGDSRHEEVNIIEKGRNYGFSIKEGYSCLNDSDCNHIENEGVPIYVYNHSETASHAVLGGYVYRGTTFPALNGIYVFGDVMTRDVFTLRETNGGWHSGRLSQCPEERCACDARAKLRNFQLSFAQDAKGELYMLTTSELNTYTSRGVIVQMTSPEKPTVSVTCDAPRMYALSAVTILIALTSLCTMLK